MPILVVRVEPLSERREEHERFQTVVPVVAFCCHGLVMKREHFGALGEARGYAEHSVKTRVAVGEEDFCCFSLVFAIINHQIQRERDGQEGKEIQWSY